MARFMIEIDLGECVSRDLNGCIQAPLEEFLNKIKEGFIPSSITVTNNHGKQVAIGYMDFRDFD